MQNFSLSRRSLFASAAVLAASTLAARGWTNQEIADHLGVSVNTVKTLVSSSLRKLGVSSRRELGRFMLP